MAREPEFLLLAVAAKDKARADELERQIDREMDTRYRGGDFKITVAPFSDAVLRALRERYAKWTLSVTVRPDSDPRETVAVAELVFTPLRT